MVALIAPLSCVSAQHSATHPTSKLALFWIIGAVWFARSAQSFTHPAFTDPQSAWDWCAVVSYSVALPALAVGLVVLARLVGGRIPLIASLVAATGATIAAVGNVIEDGLGDAWAGDALYLPGSVLYLLGLIALTLAIATERKGLLRLLTLVPAATLVGLMLLERGGGVLVLAAWGGLAIACSQTRVTPAARG